MKRIAVLSVHTCPLGHLGTRDTGGMNVYVRELSRELGRCGFQVDVFTRYRNCDHPCEVELGEGARLVHLGAGAAPELSKYDLYDYMPEFASNVVSFQQNNGLRYDLIHSHYWLSGWVGEILKACWGIPHLVTFHTLGRIKNLVHEIEREPELRLATEQRVIKEADHILALTAPEKALLSELYGVKPDKVSVVPGGIDLQVFRPTGREQARKELMLSANEPIVLYVGRMEPLKGLDILIRALSLLPESRTHCLVVGGNATDDGEMAQLRILAQELSIAPRMSFLGPVEHENLPRYYAAADVTAVPSRYESFGLVALESLACGTPVVASEGGGLPTIVEHGVNGLLVSDFDPARFSDSLGLLLRDEGLRASMSKEAVTTAKGFAWPGITSQVLDLYRQLELAGAAV